MPDDQKKKPPFLDDDDTDDGSGSGALKRKDSYLVEDTDYMKRQQREIVQTVERKRFAKVNERDHSERLQAAAEGELQNDILQHPDLNTQANDGIDPDLNPAPPLNTEARREYDKELQKQNELKKQLNPEYAPSFNPKPSGL